MIYGKGFLQLLKIQISDYGALCDNTNNDDHMFDNKTTNKTVHRSLRTMKLDTIFKNIIF